MSYNSPTLPIAAASLRLDVVAWLRDCLAAQCMGLERSDFVQGSRRAIQYSTTRTRHYQLCLLPFDKMLLWLASDSATLAMTGATQISANCREARASF